jgi:hypothetical protein
MIIDRPGMKNLMIEINSTDRVSKDDAKSLLTLGNDLDRKAEKWLISCDPLEHKFENVRVLHWQKAVKELFG